MTLLIVLHLLAACALPFTRGKATRVLAAAVPAATFAWLVAVAPGVVGGEPLTETIAWVPGLELTLDLRLDTAALLLALIVSGIGTMIALYAGGYFRGKAGSPRFLAALIGFAGSMIGLAVSDHLIALYLFWEATTVTSYLLIGHDDRSETARSAARQAALITVFGGLVMLGGIVMLGVESGTFVLSELVAAPPSGGVVAVAVGLILVGALTKSAQFPFHDWLPGAMAAPTPASAYLHSATMVKAGVFLLLRIAPVAVGAGYWTPLVSGLGAVTMVLGAWRALREHDLKLILAYGTLSQLGLLTVLAGGAEPSVVTAGFVMLAAHALFKAALFLVAGAVDLTLGTRDIRVIGGLARTRPVLTAAAVAAGLSMAGVPPLFGFVAKEAALEALLGTNTFLAFVVAASAVLTVAYTARVLRPFFAAEGPDPKPVAPVLTIMPVLLAAGGVILGLVPGLAKSLLDGAGSAVTGVEDAVKIVLWPGFTPALALSVVSLLLGVAVAAAADRVDRWIERVPRLPSARAAFGASVDGLLGLAARSTAVFQSGSLPVYLGVVLITVLAVPGVALLSALDVPDGAYFAEGWIEAVVYGVMALGAIVLVLVRRRFAALLLLGSVGYGMAALFVLQGAPDLALTQLLIETVGLVVLALVLYRMPIRFQQSSWLPARVLRVVVAVGVGVFVTVALLAAGSPEPVRDASQFYAERSLPDGGGRNIVNVILTDFRALDTFGEITVLVTAAIGVTALLAGARRTREDGE